jgi:hypothetical protein
MTFWIGTFLTVFGFMLLQSDNLGYADTGKLDSEKSTATDITMQWYSFPAWSWRLSRGPQQLFDSRFQFWCRAGITSVDIAVGDEVTPSSQTLSHFGMSCNL